MREDWKEVRLADYYDISSGLSKPAKDFGSGFPFLSFKDIFHNYFVPNELSQLVKSTEKEQTKCSVKKGDIFLTRTSETIEELGMSCVALKDYPNATFNGFSKRLRPKPNSPIDSKFIGFYLRSVQFRAEITAYSSLTTRASLNNGMINRLKIYLPPLPTQRKIANILSAYDDLIKNNRRRIALLEEQAQQTYEEWFVRLRFPGFEDVEVVDGLPKGWRKESLGQLVKLIRKTVSAKEINSDIPYIGLEHIPRKSITLSTWEYAEKVSSNKIPFKINDILFGKIRPYFHKVGVALIDGIASTDTIILRPKNIKYHGLVLQTVFSENFVNTATQSSNGTKMPRANWNVLKEYEVIIPNDKLLIQYQKVSESIIKSIKNLTCQNRLLQEARDILLPRLMLGMVDVEEVMKTKQGRCDHAVVRDFDNN